MKGSSLLIMYVAALAVFFIILVILTIALITSRSGKKKSHKKKMGYDEDYTEDKEHNKHSKKETSYEEVDMSETRLEDVAGQATVSNNELSDEDFAFMDSAFGMMEESDDDIASEVKNTLGDILDEEEQDVEESVYDAVENIDLEQYENSEEVTEEDQYEEVEETVEEGQYEEVEETVEEEQYEEVEETVEEGQYEEVEETVEEEQYEEVEETVEEEQYEEVKETVEEEQYEEVEEIPKDSAFAPEPEEKNTVIGMTNEEINASVKEAVALGEAVSKKEIIFGIEDEFRSKKERKKSTVSSDEEFFWYNKLDVMEKPKYKTAEMYYHYFNIAADCIEDLLIEMYDCALVRTEEIRYIAYGIEPRAVSMKEILTSTGTYSETKKIKEPTTQDLVRIYEKWCGYVDKLFDIIEIHADEYTINEIRERLCAFGRNDVQILLEGK